MRNWEPSREDDVFSVPISVVRGVTPQHIIVIRSSVLQHLAYYRPLEIYLTSGQIIIGKLTRIDRRVDDSILHQLKVNKLALFLM